MHSIASHVKLILVYGDDSYILGSVLLIAITAAILVKLKCFTATSTAANVIPGKLGLTETFSFLAAANSTKGCYHFVKQRRSRYGKWFMTQLFGADEQFTCSFRAWRERGVCFRMYGKWFRTRLFGTVHVFVPSVEGARVVFSNDFVVFKKGYLKSMEDAVGKKSLLCAPREIHSRLRKILADPFSVNSMSKFVPKFDRELSERLRRREREGGSFRVLEFSMKAAFDGICELLMSIKDEPTLEKLEKDVTIVADSMLSVPLKIPGSRYYKSIKARARVMETFKGIIRGRREGEEIGDDLLGCLLKKERTSSEEEKTEDDEEILDNLLTLLIAGQGTTGAAIMWCVHFLSQNQNNLVLQNLREEQLGIAREKGDGEVLKYEDLMKMSYGSKVVKETLRMANILMWYPREVLEDCNIQGYEIKKGWKVNVDATHIHYDPEIYEDPNSFDPSRFDEMPKPYSYMPFGLGPRTCLGMNMAKLTMLVFLHRLTTCYTWTVDDEDLSLEKKSHIPRLQSGCPITLNQLLP